jgi:hypothetical protein
MQYIVTPSIKSKGTNPVDQNLILNVPGVSLLKKNATKVTISVSIKSSRSSKPNRRPSKWKRNTQLAK